MIVCSSFITEQMVYLLNSITETIRLPPNVVVEWLTLLLRIRKVAGLILGSGERLYCLRF
jgi:hypothetical protein